MIHKIYEVYHFPESRRKKYNPESKKGSVFGDYINMFLKLKQQASGFPPAYETEDERRQYIQDYFEQEGIFLEYDKIKHNPGLRFLAKTCLNSLWGKFSQRNNRAMTKYFMEDKVDEWLRLLADPVLKMKNFIISDENVLLMEYVKQEGYAKDPPTNNLFISTTTTSNARCHLFEHMSKIPEGDLFYVDTDSLLFRIDQGKSPLRLGDMLGQLTDELPPNDSIESWIGCGPKNYGYQLRSGKQFAKIRSFTQSYQTSQVLNFTTMYNMMMAHQNESSDVPEPIHTIEMRKIHRDKYTSSIFTAPMTKSYRIVNDKRLFDQRGFSVPYGYVRD